MTAIAKATQGFVYLVSVTGVTGAQDKMQARVGDLVDMLHSVTDKPVGGWWCAGQHAWRCWWWAGQRAWRCWRCG